jgi:hypothetical protein
VFEPTTNLQVLGPVAADDAPELEPTAQDEALGDDILHRADTGRYGIKREAGGVRIIEYTPDLLATS